jgi:outer membrane receptor for ferrienterochelin and colicin
MRRVTPLFLLLSAASVAGCASSSPRPSAQSAPIQTITAEEIAHSGFNNAWDFLRARARQWDFYEDRYGRPRGIRTRRGRSTINMDSDTPMIIVDGARVVDFGSLRDMPTDAISSIEIMTGIAGTATQGTNAVAGVIYIHTWEASGG